MKDNLNVLIVAPHPDDEVLGCGGLIKAFSAKGKKVYVLVMTRGKKRMYSDKKVKNVREEALSAHQILGVTKTRFLDFEAPELDLLSISEIATAILKSIKEFCIDTLFLPHRGDIHNDHKAVFNAGLVAARPTIGNTVKQIFAYETLSETEWAVPTGGDFFIPTFFFDIHDYFDDKLNAMRCFKSQLKEFPATRSIKTIEALANYRGSTVGLNHAEAFNIIRIIED